jgi:hypothetical protein
VFAGEKTAAGRASGGLTKAEAGAVGLEAASEEDEEEEFTEKFSLGSRL